MKTYLIRSHFRAELDKAAAALRARGFSCSIGMIHTHNGAVYALRADKPRNDRARQIERDLRDAPLRPDQREKLMREYVALSK